jgi:hypothetical protein
MVMKTEANVYNPFLCKELQRSGRKYVIHSLKIIDKKEIVHQIVPDKHINVRLTSSISEVLCIKKQGNVLINFSFMIQ